MNRSCIVLAVTILSFLFCAMGATANERIVINPNKSANDKRSEYSTMLLREALSRTAGARRPFTIEPYPVPVTRNRALSKLKNGKIDVFDAASRPAWEKTAIPIRIPIRKGLQGYRLFLIRGADQKKFDAVDTFDDLLKYRMGGDLQWSTTLAMKRLNIPVYGGSDYESLFKMLAADRFDYFPRGINEVFREQADRVGKLKDLSVEKKLAIYIPLPTHFFVTPKKPELAARISAGLTSMIEDGTFDRLFYDYHQADIQKADLGSRKIFRVRNLNLSEDTPFNVTHYWYVP